MKKWDIYLPNKPGVSIIFCQSSLVLTSVYEEIIRSKKINKVYLSIYIYLFIFYSFFKPFILMLSCVSYRWKISLSLYFWFTIPFLKIDRVKQQGLINSNKEIWLANICLFKLKQLINSYHCYKNSSAIKRLEINVVLFWTKLQFCITLL